MKNKRIYLCLAQIENRRFYLLYDKCFIANIFLCSGIEENDNRPRFV